MSKKVNIKTPKDAEFNGNIEKRNLKSSNYKICKTGTIKKNINWAKTWIKNLKILMIFGIKKWLNSTKKIRKIWTTYWQSIKINASNLKKSFLNNLVRKSKNLQNFSISEKFNNKWPNIKIMQKLIEFNKKLKSYLPMNNNHGCKRELKKSTKHWLIWKINKRHN